jgi:histidine triad (HIT) family protein
VDDCLFCKIVAGEVPSEKVHETTTTYAFRDIAPHAPTHVLVVPKAHHADLAATVAADRDLLADVFQAACDVAQQEGLEGGYRLIANTGPDSGQTVFHLHVHVVGGKPMSILA